MIISWLLSRVHHWMKYRETLSELSHLTDHELTDIGVTRGNIEFEARRAAHI